MYVTNKQLISEVKRLQLVEVHAQTLLLALHKDGFDPMVASRNVFNIIRDLKSSFRTDEQ